MKPWKARLEEHVGEWSDRLKPSWIPRFVYHVTDVSNAVSILQAGRLYSRRRALELGCMQVDQASSQVIDVTRTTHQRYVRLYFRPRTPTQYHNEGIRPPTAVSTLQAHCPTPVFFCFDLVDTISMDDTSFSDGNMASAGVKFGRTEKLFQELPFDKIYHRGAFSSEKRSIIYHRSAEVLVPDELELNHKLRMIACRSVAEQRTLLNLLDTRTKRKWEARIRIGHTAFFEREWWFVQNVVARDKHLVVTLNAARAPISLGYERRGHGSESFRVTRTLDPWQQRWDLTARTTINGLVRIWLAGHLAFQDRVVGADVPF